MKVWAYEFEFKWYWVAETPDGVRTRAFQGGAPGDEGAAATALAAADIIHAEVTTKGQAESADLSPFLAVEIRPPQLSWKERFILISRPGDTPTVVVESGGGWVGKPCHGEREADALAAAIHMLESGAVQPITFKEPEDWISDDSYVAPTRK